MFACWLYGCSSIHLSAGQRKVIWHNMREEPVLYINGKPYVVREANKPFANLEYTGEAVLRWGFPAVDFQFCNL